MCWVDGVAGFVSERRERFGNSFDVRLAIGNIERVSPGAFQFRLASGDEVSVVFIPSAPAPLVAPRNIVPAGEREF